MCFNLEMKKKNSFCNSCRQYIRKCLHFCLITILARNTQYGVFSVSVGLGPGLALEARQGKVETRATWRDLAHAVKDTERNS